MKNAVQSIELDKLVAHPGNPNRMSEVSFRKLVRNIERTGLYEPLIVRPHPERQNHFEIINGHHRLKALSQLGYKSAAAMVWDIDDEQVDVLLATLNRLGGSDVLSKKIELLKRLTERFGEVELSKLIPQTAKQIERLQNLKMPTMPAIDGEKNRTCYANPLVFFVTDAQQQIIEQAIATAIENNSRETAAAKKAAALTKIAQYFIGES